MRLASFIFVSLMLHAAALLVLPRSDWVAQHELVPVLILSNGTDQRASSASQSGGGGDRDAGKSRSPARETSGLPGGKLQDRSELTSVASPASAAPNPEMGVNNAVDARLSDAAGLTVAASSESSSGGGTAAGGTGGVNGWGEGRSGSGDGSTGSGSGGVGAGINRSKQVQAAYGTTAKPEYPERARREGKEGRVLLRVLVDIQGRSEIVQIDTSSGSELLDHAARDAVKRWRFSPARDGDKAVSSWVKIPVDFRLSDLRN